MGTLSARPGQETQQYLGRENWQENASLQTNKRWEQGDHSWSIKFDFKGWDIEVTWIKWG